MKLTKGQVLWRSNPCGLPKDQVSKCVVVGDYDLQEWGSKDSTSETQASVLVFSESFGHEVYVRTHELYLFKNNAKQRVALEKKLRDLRITDIVDSLEDDLINDPDPAGD